MSIWAELNRRNVYKVGAAYLIVAWLLAQVASVVAPALSLPSWVTPLVVFLLVLAFPIALILAWAYEVTPDGIKPTRNVPLADSIRHVTGQKLNYIVTGLLVAAVGFIAVDYYVLRGTPTESAGRPAPAADPSSAGAMAVDPGGADSSPPIVAVLPFDNLSPNPDDAYFASGLHDEILNQLAKLDSIRVISRTSVLRYAENRRTIPQIAAELSADAIMEGSVRYAGDRILVTAQLIDPATDTHLWTQTYPGDLSDLEQLFAIQADIAMNVANALRAELSAEDRTSLARRPTASREAYELYLASLNATRLLDTARATQQIERALELDPNFAEAWAQKAWLQAATQAGLPTEGATSRLANARRDALHAVELAPDSPAVHSAYAFVLTQQGDWIEARRAHETMLALGADLTDASLVFHQLSTGDFAGAKSSTQALYEKDPLNPNALGFLLLSHGFLGESREEAEVYAKGTALFDAWFLGELAEGYLRLARRDFEHMRKVAPLLGRVHNALVGYLDTPEAGIAEARKLSGEEAYRTNIARINLALWVAFFGDDELALSLLTAALAESRTNTYYIWMPLLARARQRPAFKALVRDLGLVEYWREYGWPPICQPTQGDDFACR
jgi:TolB-like protein